MIPFVGRHVDRLLSRGKGLDASGDPFGPPLSREETEAGLARVRGAREGWPPILREPPAGSRDWCVLAPPYGALGRKGELGLYAVHAGALRRAGFGVAVLALPYHGPRALPERPSGWGFVRADLGATQRSILDAATDAMAAARGLRETGASRVVGMGLSLGSAGLGLAAALGAPFDALAFAAGVDNPTSFYGTGDNRAARRATLAAADHDLPRIAEAFAPLSPSTFPAPAARSAFVIPPHDAVVPADWQERWRAAWGGVPLSARGHGHGTALASPLVARSMAAWLASP